jgi:hypothetical protein
MTTAMLELHDLKTRSSDLFKRFDRLWGRL